MATRKVVLGLGAVFLTLTALLGFVVWQKFQPEKKLTVVSNLPEIKKVDLSTQPEWVQKLEVTATRGRSGNGLANVTFKVMGVPRALVATANYVVQYQTKNKGAQGALSTKPIEVNGATSFNKTIDFGTCSTKSCVSHDGVTEIELELDFTTSDGSQFFWAKTVTLN